MKTLSKLLLPLLVAASAFGMERASGWCMQGNQQITVAGIASAPTTPVQASYPSCSVTVYLRGTGTKANIFSDNLGTLLSNPFSATTNGYWFFYGAGRFDVQLSGGGFASPITLGDIKLLDLVSVTDFGAQCNGNSTSPVDDTASLQIAINTASAGSVQLMIPGGACLFTSLSLPSNTVLVGQGQGISTLRAISSTTNTPLITASNAANVILRNFTLDGNSSTQSATNVNGLNLTGVSGFSAAGMSFTAIVGSPIFGRDWTNFNVQNCSFTNYASKAATFPNAAAVQMDYANATTASTNISIVNNLIDGSATHVGGVKLNGTVAYPVSQIHVEGNTVVVGNANAGTGGATLGIELYSNSGLGFFQFSIANNLIRGESSASPGSVATAGAFGISACGTGGYLGTISANVIRWVGTYSIEVCGSNIAVTGNTLDTTASVILNNSYGISGVAFFDNVTFVGNHFYNPLGLVNSTTVGSNDGIHLYTQGGGGLRNVTIAQNAIQYVSTLGTAGNNVGVHLQCNSGSGAILDVLIDGNVLRGSGSANGAFGLDLEQDVTCPVTGTLVSANTLDNWQSAVYQGGDTGTRLMGNTYLNNGANYAGTQDASTIVMDPVLAANSATAWPTLAPTTNIILTNPGQYFQTNVSGGGAPNVMTWNTTNGGTGAIGGVISTNSRQRTAGDSPASGWVQTSSSSLTRALYTAFGACRFAAAFGPATGAGPNPPSDNTELVAEDTNSACTSEASTFGGVGIGSAAITAGARIANVFIGKTTWTPGTITAGSVVEQSVGVTGCNAGDIGQAGFSGFTGTQTLVIWANTTTNSVNVQIYNFGASPITLGSGTLTYACIQSR